MTPIADIAAALVAADGAAFAAREVRVRWTSRSTGSFSSYRRRGRVTRATGSTIWVIPDGRSDAEPMRATREGHVHVDILTPLELALEVWAAERPATKLVTVSAAGLGDEIAHGAEPCLWLDAAVNRKREALAVLSEIEADAGVLRAWLVRRPTHTVGELVEVSGVVDGSQYIETTAPGGAHHLVKRDADGSLWCCRWLTAERTWDDWIALTSDVRLDHVGRLIASVLPPSRED
jgi:hypothetical protein